MSVQTLNLPITGMSCANCAANITRTVSKLAGVTAESQGLCFMNVRYDPKYKLPEEAEAFPFANGNT